MIKHESGFYVVDKMIPAAEGLELLSIAAQLLATQFDYAVVGKFANANARLVDKLVSSVSCTAHCMHSWDGKLGCAWLPGSVNSRKRPGQGLHGQLSSLRVVTTQLDVSFEQLTAGKQSQTQCRKSLLHAERACFGRRPWLRCCGATLGHAV